MLANPTSTAPADAARRNQVRQRVVDYNAGLVSACAADGPDCVYDGGAVFGYRFGLGQISGWDPFHPNLAGQQVFAELSYVHGFNW
jgi:hypothetical protein